MAPMPYPNGSSTRLSWKARKILLALARESIENGLTSGQALQVDADRYPPELQERRACFVTLNRNGSLRGCIGHLEAIQSLVLDVAENAWSAAFRDPRFPSLEASETADLDIHISVLSPASPLSFSSEQELIDQIRPGIDGLILEEGGRRGTFLPSVWQSLPNSRRFLQHLKQKAGLSADHWSDKIRAYRYETESFSAVDAS